ncbi:hypothetical protein [Bacillus xiapuensis]|uniref:Uncharacterized protein n=1 Tax=Bacillus xiapuensis TaxID=2014075 RepID=A0ABU6N884_9BACI|nr:hypothetical protein [Bacillus xiapuensis]
MDREPLTFNPIIYAGAIEYVQSKWNGYRLTQHERYIAEEIYNYIRTALEIEEIKLLDIK